MFSNEVRGGGRRAPLRVAAAVVAAIAAAGLVSCSDAGSGGPGGPHDAKDGQGPGGGAPAAASAPSQTESGTSVGAGHVPAAGTASPAPASASASASASAETLPLAGRTVVVDPGHNIGNARHTAEINKLVDIGTGRKECDTTGTETDAGYPEATYTLDVSRRVRTILRARGATVVLTQDGDRAYGPCVDERARIGNRAHADAAISVHADGAPAADRGFHVIAPKALHAGAADTRSIAAPSLRLATTVRAHFAAATKEPFADYLGGGTGMTVRGDLGGLDLSTVPKIFIECGNMRNARDAAELTDVAWRQRAAEGIADGLTAFLEGKR